MLLILNYRNLVGYIQVKSTIVNDESLIIHYTAFKFLVYFYQFNWNLIDCIKKNGFIQRIVDSKMSGEGGGGLFLFCILLLLVFFLV